MEDYIKSVTGSGDKYIESYVQFAQINIALRDNVVDSIMVIENALKVLNNNNNV